MRRLLVPILAATLSLVGLGAPAAHAATFTSAPIPRLVGTAAVGRFVTISAGTWSPTPTAMTYRFYKTCGTTTTKVQAGSSRVYYFKAADVGCTFRGQVAASRTGYTTTSRTSPATAPVAAATLTGYAPKITGAVSLGAKLTASSTGWPVGTTLTYRWYKVGPDGKEYALSTGYSRLVTSSEYGFRYLVKVTGAKAGYTSRTLASAPTAFNLGPTAKTMSAQYGIYNDIVYSGVGSKLITLPAGADHGLLIASHAGDGEFSVEVLDANEGFVDWPVWATGAYTGTSAFVVDPADDSATTLSVETTGTWTIRVRSMAFAPALGSTASGTGDQVFLYGGTAGTWNVTNDGEYFWMGAINPVTGMIMDLMEKEQPFAESATRPAGPVIVGIIANGSWTVKAPA